MVKVINYVKNAFSDSDAKILDPIIEKEFAEHDSVTLDFTGIRFYTTLFFNNSICKYILLWGKEKFDEKFYIQGLSEIGKDTYLHSYENACQIASL